MGWTSFDDLQRRHNQRRRLFTPAAAAGPSTKRSGDTDRRLPHFRHIWVCREEGEGGERNKAIEKDHRQWSDCCHWQLYSLGCCSDKSERTKDEKRKHGVLDWVVTMFCHKPHRPLKKKKNGSWKKEIWIRRTTNTEWIWSEEQRQVNRINYKPTTQRSEQFIRRSCSKKAVPCASNASRSISPKRTPPPRLRPWAI